MIRSVLLVALLILPTALQAQPRKPVDAASASASAEGMVRIGDRLRATGDPAGALGFYQRALEVEPGNLAALRGAGQLLADGGAHGAADAYWQQVLVRAPNDPLALLGRARALNAQNQPETALKMLDSLPAAEAAWAGALLERALALDLGGNPQAAQLVYADALQAPGAQIEDVRIRLALSFALSKDYRTANQLLQQIVNTPGMGDRVRATLGLAYALAGDAEAGSQIAALGKTPDEAQALLPFYNRLPGLSLKEQAAAVHLGMLPVVVPVAAAAPAVAEAPAPVVEPAAAPAAAPPPDAVAPSGWVQLGAFSSPAMLMAHWRKVQAAAPDLVGKLAAGVSRIAGFDRLLLGPMTAEQADALATALQARSLDAFVRNEALAVTPVN